MAIVAIVVGVLLVATALADLVNTLVTTQTSRARWWLTLVLYRTTWRICRRAALAVADDGRRERLLSAFAPLSVLALLSAWVTQQIVGFGLIWWGVDRMNAGAIDGATSLGEAVYFSGVVYFTLGFGEIVPVEAVPRFAALVEGFFGVLTTAMVIGYLPALYGAYSERERALMVLDDGSDDRITPTNLVLSRAPTGRVEDLDDFFRDWERWVAGVLETHTTFPMLMLFRSQAPGQNWVTALGLVADAALHVELTEARGHRSSYWLLRRSIRLFEHLTEGADLSAYRAQLDQTYADDTVFRQLYDDLDDVGFDLLELRGGPGQLASAAETVRRTARVPDRRAGGTAWLLGPRGR